MNHGHVMINETLIPISSIYLAEGCIVFVFTWVGRQGHGDPWVILAPDGSLVMSAPREGRPAVPDLDDESSCTTHWRIGIKDREGGPWSGDATWMPMRSDA